MDGQKLRKLEKSNSLHQTFIKVKEEKLLIWYNKTTNVVLSEQRITQFFCSINCYSFNTYLRKKNRKIYLRFAFFLHHSYSRKMQNFAKKLAKYELKCSHFFAGNPSSCSKRTLAFTFLKLLANHLRDIERYKEIYVKSCLSSMIIYRVKL